MNMNENGENVPKKPLSALSYFSVSLIMLAIAIWLADRFQSEHPPLETFIVLLVAGMAFAAFIFGTMRSYGHYTGKHLGGNLILGGPVVGAALVVVGGYFFLTELRGTPPHPVPTPEFTISFHMEFEGESDAKLPILSYKQQKPIPRKKYPLAPSSDGEYVRDRVDLPGPGKQYVARMRTQIDDSKRGTPNEVRVTTLCFLLRDHEPQATYHPELECKEGSSCKIGPLAEDWFKDCEPGIGRLPSLAVVYASQGSTQQGWLVPTLETLRERHESQQITYTAFHVESGELTGLEEAETFDFQIFVNDVPIYVDRGSTPAA